MLTLLLTCALLIILPILYDRYHRRSPYSYKLPTTPTTTYHSQTPPTSSYTPSTCEDLTSNLDGGEDNEVSDFTPTRAGTGIRDREMSGYSTGISRKPWDPPFPRAPTSQQPQENKNPWLSYLHPSHYRADSALQARAASLSPSTQPIAPNSLQSPLSNPTSNRTSVLKMAMFVMAVIVFIFAFAILIAHCLAWFIV